MATTDPTKKNAPIPGYAAGASVRRTLGNAVGAVADTGAQFAARTAAPVARSLVAGAGFAAGLAGAAPATPATPAPRGAAQPASAAQPRGYRLIEPSNAASMSSSPQAPVRRSLPQAADPSVGQFNGRNISRSDAESIASGVSSVQPGTAVAAGPDQLGAYAPPAAARTLGTGITAPADVTAPDVTPPRVTADLTGAEDERKKALGRVDGALSRLEGGPSGLNSRGKRQLYAQLVGEQNALAGKRVDQATSLELEDARLGGSAAEEGARLRASAAEGNANRSLEAQNLAAVDVDRDAARAADQRAVNRVLVDRGGAVSALRNDGSLAPVTDAAGKPFQQQPDSQLQRNLQVSGDVQYKALSERLAQLQTFGRPEGADGAGYDKEVEQIRARMSQLDGSAAANKAPAAGTVRDGYRFKGGDPANQANWEKVS